MTLAKVTKQSPGRDATISTAYATGAYSQREIGENFGLHPSTINATVRKHENS